MSQSKTLCLDEIKVLVTSGCNLNCTHCFRTGDQDEYSLSEEQLIEIVDFAVSNSTRSLSLSGGEFFTHPFAYQLIEYCVGKQLSVKILTNATSIDTGFFKEASCANLVSFQVSVDGTEKTHDRRRGAGSFRAMMDNVRTLVEGGYTIGASTVLDCFNYRDAIEIIRMPYFSSFNFLPLASTNETNRYMDDLPYDEVREYEETIKLLYGRQEAYADSAYRCHMFPHGLGIKYDGGVYPCAVARDYGLLEMGNLNRESLASIVESYPGSLSGEAVLQYVGNDIEECNSCDEKLRCNRGCRVRALKYHGNLLSPDPFCCRIIKNEHADESINCLFWGKKV